MSLLDEVDNLFRQAVTEPGSVNDQMLADWAEGVAGSYVINRDGARLIRRCLNVAPKLASFWVHRETLADDPVEWRSRVDLAMGIRAWRPQLELAQFMLERLPDEETYDRAARLFRIVNNEEFLDGMPYNEWMTDG